MSPPQDLHTLPHLAQTHKLPEEAAIGGREKREMGKREMGKERGDGEEEIVSEPHKA